MISCWCGAINVKLNLSINRLNVTIFTPSANQVKRPVAWAWLDGCRWFVPRSAAVDAMIFDMRRWEREKVKERARDRERKFILTLMSDYSEGGGILRLRFALSRLLSALYRCWRPTFLPSTIFLSDIRAHPAKNSSHCLAADIYCSPTNTQAFCSSSYLSDLIRSLNLTYSAVATLWPNDNGHGCSDEALFSVWERCEWGAHVRSPTISWISSCLAFP